MKIGIITFHNAANYGAVLQTYALQQVIKKIGAECDVVDYRSPYIEEAYKPFSKKRIKTMRNLLSSIVYAPIIISKNKRFKKFVKNKIKLSDKINSQEKLKKVNYIYDKIIVGSDQVWNGDCTNQDKTFLLDFIEKPYKKNSYAASFGASEVSNELKKEYSKLLFDFEKISVRERQGANLIKELTNKEVDVHLDPTLLLDKKEWIKSCGVKINDNKYILVYLMAQSPSILKFAEQLSKDTGLEIIYINSMLTKTIKAKYIRTAGPNEFISLFANAKYIVTNSFHGTVFAINFNKSFFLELQPEPAKANSRLENIMDLLDLRNREIIKGKNESIYKEIDYNKVNKKLEEERSKSITYLKSIIGKDNE